jgi:hypothetical protein
MALVASVGESICAAFDYAWTRFTGRLEGLEDAEYLWEPVPGCWSLREDSQGRWRIEGGGADAPAVPPVTTIAWRIGHIAGMAVGGFANHLFGDGSLRVEDLSFPRGAAEVPAFCEDHYRQWRDGLGQVDDERWWQPLGPNWQPYEDANTVDLVLHVLDEVVHHGGEVGLMRDLYLRRDQLK